MVIVITVTESTTQLISGIPLSVTITTDISAMIFYTFDGTTPTTSSDVYTGTLKLPTYMPSVHFNVLATDGSDSGTFSKVYSPDITHSRLPRSKAQILTPQPTGCGSRGETPKVLYSQPGDTPMDAFGVTPVDFDGYGYNPNIYPVRQYDEPIPVYEIKYSESDWTGKVGAGIGTLPAKVTITQDTLPPAQDSIENPTYDPRALVTFHDGTDPNSNETTIFRPYYEGENFKTDMGGQTLTTTASKDGNGSVTGALINYFYNPKDNTLNFYYRDNRQNRWIISKEPVRRASPSTQNPLRNYISPNCGDGHVYRWLLFRSTHII